MVLIDNMYLWIYCLWIDRTHLMNDTREFPEIYFQRLARTLRCNRSNNWSIGFKSRHFASHLRLCRFFLQPLLVCFYPRNIMRNPVPTSYRDWHGYKEKEPTEWLHFDTSSQWCYLEWLHLEFSCAWTPLSAFCYAYFRQIYTFLPNSTITLTCTRS